MVCLQFRLVWHYEGSILIDENILLKQCLSDPHTKNDRALYSIILVSDVQPGRKYNSLKKAVKLATAINGSGKD